MRTVSKKMGRKQNHHIDSRTGKPVPGLSRMTDGRWRIIGTHMRFTEPDEQKAIERFHRLSGAETEEQLYRRTEGRSQKPLTIDQWWDYATRQILQRPHWVAKKTGIEWIAYGPELKPPVPLPTLYELVQIWTNHAVCRADEKRRTAAAFRRFVKDTGITSIREITPEVAVRWRDMVWAQYENGKVQSHLFHRTRRVLSFAAGDRAIAVDAINKALVTLKLLKPNASTVSYDPQPIERSDWNQLLVHSTGDVTAMLLLMLNCAMYLKEVIDLRWSDIKHGKYLIVNRNKTGKCIRAAALWPETIAALSKISKRMDCIFLAYHGAPIDVSGAGKRWRRLRKKAGVGVSVTPSHLRDGALTAAAQANVNSQLCKLLAGHRCGIEDHYVRRNPAMVKPATDAVYEHYMR